MACSIDVDSIWKDFEDARQSAEVVQDESVIEDDWVLDEETAVIELQKKSDIESAYFPKTSLGSFIFDENKRSKSFKLRRLMIWSQDRREVAKKMCIDELRQRLTSKLLPDAVVDLSVNIALELLSYLVHKLRISIFSFSCYYAYKRFNSKITPKEIAEILETDTETVTKNVKIIRRDIYDKKIDKLKWIFDLKTDPKNVKQKQGAKREMFKKKVRELIGKK